MSMKIGQVAKLLNIRVETIRFYERNRILSPRRAEGSSYREYDAWDLFNLTECMQQRARGFSVKDIRKLMRDADLDDVRDLISNRIEETEAEVSLGMRKAAELKSWKAKLETTRYNVGRYWYEKNPEYAYISCLKYDGGEYGDYDFSNPDLAKWFDQLPFTKYCFLAQPEDLASSLNRFESVLAMSKEDPSYAEVRTTSEVRTIPAGIYLHTIVDIGERGTIGREALDGPARYFRENGLSVNGAVMGELLLRHYEAGAWHRYVELNIPVK